MFGSYEITNIVENSGRVQVWLQNAYVTVGSAYVSEIDDNEYSIEVDIRAYGRVSGDSSRIERNIREAIQILLKDIQRKLESYRDRYGFGYELEVNNVETDDIDFD